MMENGKVDRRVDRTRRLLREALMSLIVEKGYDAVTIEDITGRAELGRTTFYLHYKDKEDLLLESIDTIADELTEKIGREFQTQNADREGQSNSNRFKPIVFVFQHAQENKLLYQIILRGEGSTAAASRIRMIIIDAARMFFKIWADAKIMADMDEEQLHLISVYFGSSLLGFLTWWLETENPYTPEEMGEHFRVFAFQGIRNFLVRE
jgi:AcrR family transcriptional regulator